jgi:hypothetical protein
MTPIEYAIRQAGYGFGSNGRLVPISGTDHSQDSKIPAPREFVRVPPARRPDLSVARGKEGAKARETNRPSAARSDTSGTFLDPGRARSDLAKCHSLVVAAIATDPAAAERLRVSLIERERERQLLAEATHAAFRRRAIAERGRTGVA